MTNDMSRHELKTNFLAEYFDISMDWVAHNRNTFYAIAGTIFGLIVFGIFFYSRLHDSRLRSEEKLSMAQYLVRSSDAGQAGQGHGMLDEIILNYGSSSQGMRAVLIKADILIRQQNFLGAETAVQSVINRNKDKKLLPFAYSVLGVIFENEGKYQQAIGVYNSYLSNFSSHFLTPRIYESLARSHELSGNMLEAKATYEKMVTMFPASPWAQNAQERIINISGILAKTPQLPAQPANMPGK